MDFTYIQNLQLSNDYITPIGTEIYSSYTVDYVSRQTKSERIIILKIIRLHPFHLFVSYIYRLSAARAGNLCIHLDQCHLAHAHSNILGQPVLNFVARLCAAFAHCI